MDCLRTTISIRETFIKYSPGSKISSCGKLLPTATISITSCTLVAKLLMVLYPQLLNRDGTIDIIRCHFYNPRRCSIWRSLSRSEIIFNRIQLMWPFATPMVQFWILICYVEFLLWLRFQMDIFLVCHSEKKSSISIASTQISCKDLSSLRI